MDEKQSLTTNEAITVDGVNYLIDTTTALSLKNGVIPLELQDQIREKQGDDVCFEFCRQRRLMKNVCDQIDAGELPETIRPLIESASVPAEILYKLYHKKLHAKADKLHKHNLITDEVLAVISKDILTADIIAPLEHAFFVDIATYLYEHHEITREILEGVQQRNIDIKYIKVIRRYHRQMLSLAEVERKHLASRDGLDMPKRKGWNRENQKKYPLKGVARCGTCGKVMAFRQSPKLGVLQCPESILEHSVCSPTVFSLSELEDTIFQCMKPLLKIVLQMEKKYNRSQTIERSDKCQQSIIELQKKQKALQQQKTQCYEDYISGKLTLEEYPSLKSHHNVMGQELAAQLTSLEKQEVALSYALMPSDLQQAAEHAKQHADNDRLTYEMVQSFIDKVYIFDTHIEIQWKFKDLFNNLYRKII